MVIINKREGVFRADSDQWGKEGYSELEISTVGKSNGIPLITVEYKG